MAGLPRWMLQHTVLVKPYLGTTGYGVPDYGPETEVRCFLDNKRRLIRAASTGDEVVSESTFYAPLDTVAPPESLVTLPNGRVATVLQALDRDGGNLPVPSHLEVVLT